MRIALTDHVLSMVASGTTALIGYLYLPPGIYKWLLIIVPFLWPIISALLVQLSSQLSQEPLSPARLIVFRSINAGLLAGFLAVALAEIPPMFGKAKPNELFTIGLSAIGGGLGSEKLIAIILWVTKTVTTKWSGGK